MPCFFLISGFLFFKGGHFCLRGYVDKLKKRFFTLLIPFILWNLLYLLPYLFKGWELIENEAGEILPIVPWFQDCEGSLFKTVYNWTYGLFINFNGASAPIDVPFWYLRDLMCMIVISPLVYYFVKYSKLIGLVLCCLVWVLLGQYRIIPYAFPIPLRPAVLFFLIGAYFSINTQK